MSLKRSLKKALGYYPGGSKFINLRNLKDSYKQADSNRKKLKVSLQKVKEFGLRPVYMDVGAAGGLSRLWKHLDKINLIEVISFDINNKWGSMKNLIPTALGPENTIKPFYVTRHPGCSSFRKPNADIVRNYQIASYFDIDREIKLEMSRFDTIVEQGKCDVPHFVKMDIQGFEYDCLLGFGKVLHDVLALELETQFSQMYEGQKVFHELHDFLISQGFALRKVENVYWPSLSDKNEINYIDEANVFYSRNARNSKEKALINLWEAIVNIEVSPYIETQEQQNRRIDNIPR